MQWLLDLFSGSGVGPTVMFLALSIFAGFLLGKIKIGGISLGITWVLFVGIGLSAFGVSLNHDMLHVIKEFGLILFVTAVGIQVGPTFFASFKSGGLKLNLCALTMVALGVVTTFVISKLSGEPLEVMAGVYTGAITNTPGMSAAQQTVTAVTELGAELDIDGPDTIANGYAVAYPLGVVGLIVSCLIIKAVCRVKLDQEPTTEENLGHQPQFDTQAPDKKLHLIPIFVAVFLGIIIGSIPIPVGMAAPVKLGLAGGPLVVALLMGHWGVRKGWFSFQFTKSHGIMMIREVGIALFLAAVGLSAGGSFVETVAQGGYMWIIYGVFITMVPTLLVGLFARIVLKVNFYTLMGMIGGGTTDPPTLAFANTVAPDQCDLPSTGYATVYPLTMFLRIFTAQLLVLLAV